MKHNNKLITKMCRLSCTLWNTLKYLKYVNWYNIWNFITKCYNGYGFICYDLYFWFIRLNMILSNISCIIVVSFLNLVSLKRLSYSPGLIWWRTDLQLFHWPWSYTKEKSYILTLFFSVMVTAYQGFNKVSPFIGSHHDCFGLQW